MMKAQQLEHFGAPTHVDQLSIDDGWHAIVVKPLAWSQQGTFLRS